MAYTSTYTLSGNGIAYSLNTLITSSAIMNTWKPFNLDPSIVNTWIEDTSTDQDFVRCTLAPGYGGRVNPFSELMTDYSFSASMLGSSKEKNLMGVVFRYTDTQHFYFFAWDGGGALNWGGQMRLYKVFPGGQILLASSPSAPWTSGQLYNVEVTAGGNRLRVTVDGTTVFDFTDNNSPYLVGGFGPYTGCQECSFTDFMGPDYVAFTVQETLPATFPYSSYSFSTATYTDQDAASLLNDALIQKASQMGFNPVNTFWQSFTVSATDSHLFHWFGFDPSMPQTTADPAKPLGFYTDLGSVTPIAPSDLQGVPETDAINWTWTNNAFNADGIQVLDENGNILLTLPADTTSYYETNLPANTPVTRSIRTYNQQGYSPIDGPATATPLEQDYFYVQQSAPDSVTGVLITDEIGTYIDWSWKDTKLTSDALGFRIYSSDGTLIETVALSASHYVQRNIVQGSTYSICVCAYDQVQDGQKTWSNPVTCPIPSTPLDTVVLPDTPTGLIGAILDTAHIEWTWNGTADMNTAWLIYDQNGDQMGGVGPDHDPYFIEECNPNTKYERYIAAVDLTTNAVSTPSNLAVVITPPSVEETNDVADIELFDPASVTYEILPKETNARIPAFKSGVGDHLDLKVKVGDDQNVQETFNYAMQLKAYLDESFHLYSKRDFSFRFTATGMTPNFVDTGNFSSYLTAYPRRSGRVTLTARITKSVYSKYYVKCDFNYDPREYFTWQLTTDVTVQNATQETLSFTADGTDQSFALTGSPVTGSITVTANGTPVNLPAYTVTNGNSLSFTPAKPAGTAIQITYMDASQLTSTTTTLTTDPANVFISTANNSSDNALQLSTETISQLISDLIQQYKTSNPDVQNVTSNDYSLSSNYDSNIEVYTNDTTNGTDYVWAYTNSTDAPISGTLKVGTGTGGKQAFVYPVTDANFDSKHAYVGNSESASAIMASTVASYISNNGLRSNAFAITKYYTEDDVTNVLSQTAADGSKPVSIWTPFGTTWTGQWVIPFTIYAYETPKWVVKTSDYMPVDKNGIPYVGSDADYSYHIDQCDPQVTLSWYISPDGPTGLVAEDYEQPVGVSVEGEVEVGKPYSRNCRDLLYLPTDDPGYQNPSWIINFDPNYTDANIMYDFKYDDRPYHYGPWIEKIIVVAAFNGRSAYEQWPHWYTDSSAATKNSGAYFVWNRVNTGSNIPIGNVYFRKYFTLAQATTVLIEASGDDVLTSVLIDGNSIYDAPFGFDHIGSKTMTLSAGTHEVLATVYAADAWISGFLFAMTDANTGTPIVVSDKTWDVSTYKFVPDFRGNDLSDVSNEILEIRYNRKVVYSPWIGQTIWYDGTVNDGDANENLGYKEYTIPIEILLPNGLTNLKYTVELSKDSPSDLQYRLLKGTGNSTGYADDLITFYCTSMETVVKAIPWYGQVKSGSGPLVIDSNGVYNFSDSYHSPYSDPTAMDNSVTPQLLPLHDYQMLLTTDNPNVDLSYEKPIVWAPIAKEGLIALHANIVNPAQSSWHPHIHNGYYYFNQSEHYLYAETAVKGEYKEGQNYSLAALTYTVSATANRNYPKGQQSWIDSTVSGFNLGKSSGLDTTTLNMRLDKDGDGNYNADGIYTSDIKTLPYSPASWMPVSLVDEVNQNLGENVQVFTRIQDINGNWTDWQEVINGIVASPLSDTVQYKLVLTRGENRTTYGYTVNDSTNFLQGQLVENTMLNGNYVQLKDETFFDGSYSGEFMSQIIDLGPNVATLKNVSVVSALPGTGSSIQIFTNTSSLPTGPWGTGWVPVSDTGQIMSPINRYIRYQARMVYGMINQTYDYTADLMNDQDVQRTSNMLIYPTSIELPIATPTGKYVSKTLDVGNVSNWNDFLANTILPPSDGGVVIQTLSGDDPFYDIESKADDDSAWTTVTSNTINSQKGRYLKYRLLFTAGKSPNEITTFVDGLYQFAFWTEVNNTGWDDPFNQNTSYGLRLSDTSKPGDYLSYYYDFGNNVSWDKFIIKMNLNGGGARFVTQSSSDGQTWSPEQDVGSDGTIYSPVARFLRWKVYITPRPTNQTDGPRIYSVTMSAVTFQSVSPEVSSISFSANTFTYTSPVLEGISLSADLYDIVYTTSSVSSLAIGANLDAKQVQETYSFSNTAEILSDMNEHQASNTVVSQMVTNYLTNLGIDLSSLMITGYNVTQLDTDIDVYLTDYTGGNSYVLAKTRYPNIATSITNNIVVCDPATGKAYVTPMPQQGAPMIVKDARNYELRQVNFYDEDGNPTLTNTEYYQADGVTRTIALGYTDIDVSSLIIYVDEENNGNWTQIAPVLATLPAASTPSSTPSTYWRQNFALDNNILYVPEIYPDGTPLKITYNLMDSFMVNYNIDPKRSYAEVTVYNPVLDDSCELNVVYETDSEDAYYKASEVNLNPMLNTTGSGFLYVIDTVEPTVKLDLYPPPSLLYANGYDWTTFSVMPKDRYGNPVVGERIVFEAVTDTVTPVPIGKIYTSEPGIQYTDTDEHGIARAIFISATDPGNVILRVTAPNANLSEETTIILKPETAMSRISIEADKRTISRNGADQIVLTVHIVSPDQTPAINEHFAITATAGDLTSSSGITNVNGDGYIYLTVPPTISPELITITATSSTYKISQSIIINAQ